MSSKKRFFIAFYTISSKENKYVWYLSSGWFLCSSCVRLPRFVQPDILSWMRGFVNVCCESSPSLFRHKCSGSKAHLSLWIALAKQVGRDLQIQRTLFCIIHPTWRRARWGRRCWGRWRRRRRRAARWRWRHSAGRPEPPSAKAGRSANTIRWGW